MTILAITSAEIFQIISLRSNVGGENEPKSWRFPCWPVSSSLDFLAKPGPAHELTDGTPALSWADVVVNVWGSSNRRNCYTIFELNPLSIFVDDDETN